MNNQNKIAPFHFFCQHIIPLIYDESLSYYEVLCKVQNKLNEVINSQNNLIDEFNKLYDFVKIMLETYTRNEVIKIMKEWLENGTLQSMLDNQVSYYTLYQPYINHQGSSYVLDNDNDTIIIDFMNTESANELINFYKSKNISKFTHAIITHYHQDHFGDLELFLNNFDFSDCVFHLPSSPQWNLFTEDTSRQAEEQSVLNLLHSKNIHYIQHKNGDKVTLKNSKNYMMFYNCDESKYTPYYTTPTNYNNFSMMIKFYNIENVILFTGDIEKLAMQNNMNILSDVKILQVPHHGTQYLYVYLEVDNYFNDWFQAMPLEMIMTQNFKEGFGTTINNISRTSGYMYHMITGVPYYISCLCGNMTTILNGFSFLSKSENANPKITPNIYFNLLMNFLGVETKFNFLNFSNYDYVNVESPTINPNNERDLNNEWFMTPNTYIFNPTIVNDVLNKPLLSNNAFYMITKQYTKTRFTQTIYQAESYGQVVYKRLCTYISVNATWSFSEWVMENGGFGWIPLPNESDLNDFTIEGSYQLIGTNTYINMPNLFDFGVGSSSATLNVYQQNNQSRFRQEINFVGGGNGLKFVRYYTTNNEWSEWVAQVPLYLSNQTPKTNDMVHGALRFNIETKNLEYWNGTSFKVISTE